MSKSGRLTSKASLGRQISARSIASQGVERPSETQLQRVTGIDGQIEFLGAAVPVGFVMSFAKKNHRQCEGRGGVLVRTGTEKTTQVCSCADARAQQNLRAVGKEMFEAGGKRYTELLREARAKQETTPK